MPAPKSFEQIIRDMRMEITKLRQRSPFSGAGFHATAFNGIESDDFDGDIDANDPGTKGWSLNNLKAAFGELILRPGSIGNDALTNPVAPGVVSNETTGFGITTSSATKLSGSITVPAGFTSAAISVIARTFALDNDTVNPTDYLYSRVTVGGVSSSEVPLAVTYNGGSGTSVSPLSVVLTSLGSSISYSVSAHSAFANWGTDALNRVSLSGSVLWFR